MTPRTEVPTLRSRDWRRSRSTWLAALAAAVSVTGCDPDASDQARATVAWERPEGSVSIVPRSESVAMFPCQQCHAKRPVNTTKRPLSEMHSRIELDHGTRVHWCYSCHDESNVDQLRLADGRKAAFDDSHELCGSCHGEKLSDWQSNVHGLTKGYWNGGPQERFTCTACHNPHKPRSKGDWGFPIMTPLAPPHSRHREKS